MTNYQHYLHHQALKIATRYRQTESELLDILQKIDKQRVYRQLGYASLFVYATQTLKLSEAVAYSFIQVARKAKEVPELKTAIDQGEITVSKAHRVVPVLTPDNHGKLLEMAKTLPKRELEREVAKLNPQAVVLEKARYVTEERLELKIGVSEALMQQLKRVQDLLSTQKRRAVSMEETLASMAEEYLERHDPLKKARRAEKRQERQDKALVPVLALETASGGDAVSSVLCPGTNTTVGECRSFASAEGLRRQPLTIDRQHTFQTFKGFGMYAARQNENNPVEVLNKPVVTTQVKHEVTLRDDGQCTYVDQDGHRCQEKRWLQIHHQIPRAFGGNNDASNLTLLCSGHHKIVHQTLHAPR